MVLFDYVQVALQFVGAASVVLAIVAPLTKNKTDDKILKFIKAVLSAVSINLNDKTLNIKSNKLNIEIKGENK